MPPKSVPLPAKPSKPYFFYGHRKPSQNRPVVYGGLFSNRQVLKPPQSPLPPSPPFDLRKWDPHHLSQNPSPPPISTPHQHLKLSPIARFIIDAFRKSQYSWGPSVVFELNKLRRVTASLVAEVLKVQDDPILASKFFHWAGKVAEMLEVLRRMREMSYKPDVFAYTAMIKILVSKGNLDGCLRVWEEMQRDGVEPDVMAYVTLVAGLCKGGRVQRGYELFKEMKKKGILIERVMYGVLIEGFVKDGKVGSACGLLKDLIDSGYRADLGIYNSLIEGMCDVKLIDRAYKLFQVTVQEGLEPGFATVKPMLLVFAEMRRMSDFCKLLEQMQKLGFSVNDDLSKFFSFVVEKGERTIMAVRVFNELKVKGYGSVLIYNILMGALHKTGKVKQALSLFQEMKDLNFEPDSSTYSNAIICYVEDENIKEACICHNKIIEMSRVPSIDAYYSLTNGLCKIGEIDAAMELVRDCLGAEKVMEVLNEMMQEGLPPDNIICSAIISGMCKYRTIEEARKVFANLRTRKLLTEANVIIYDELLIEYMEKKAADLVLSGLKFFGLESKLKAKGSTLLSR
ncbi:hypothetical protein V6Z11_A06G187100 [Gossypium hirsutum]